MVRADPSRAAKLFEQALERNPANRDVQIALGYIYQSLGNYERALVHFDAAQSLRSSDSLRLQIGYTLLSLQRTDEAYKIFQDLAGGAGAAAEPEIREKARQQLAYQPSPGSLLPGGGGGFGIPFPEWWTRIYSASYYDTRWETSFFNATVEEGHAFRSMPSVSLYGVAALSADARSSAGLIPEIFSDNTLLLGLGLRLQAFRGFSVSAQQGAAFDLIGRKNIDFVRPDFRLVGVYGWGIYAPFSLHPEVRFPFHPIVDLYSSLGYYSRYKNTIGYLQVKGGLRVLEVSHALGDVYLKANFARDAAINLFRGEGSGVRSKEYYNNIDEIGAGARFTPNAGWGLYLVGEFLRGAYAIESMVPSTRNRYYSSFRLYLIFDRTF